LSISLLITIVIMLVEFLGGWISNSLALISDAGHMLTDVGAMLLSLFAIWIAKRPRTPKMSFGYHRAEILGALISGIMIWMIAGFVIYNAVLRMGSPPEVQGPIVLIVAIIGLAANLISMKILHRASHSHINIKAAYLHLFADALGSIAAIIAGVVLWATQWNPIDPIVSIVFAALMVLSSWELVKEAITILMESTPAHLDPVKVKTDLETISQIREAHDLHIWSVSSGKLALSVHLISPNEPEEVLKEVNDLLETRYGIIHTTVQIEHPEKFQSRRCYDCAPIEA
jgi:cobalt-zinc-cadmium efflux system protein